MHWVTDRLRLEPGYSKLQLCRWCRFWGHVNVLACFSQVLKGRGVMYMPQPLSAMKVVNMTVLTLGSRDTVCLSDMGADRGVTCVPT